MSLWVHATANGTLMGPTGNIGTTNIRLHKGWNLVGYPSNSVRSVGDALYGISYDYVQMRNTRTGTIIALGATNLMKPGNGYWIHVTVAGMWILEW